jgi:hypothetical protein
MANSSIYIYMLVEASDGHRLWPPDLTMAPMRQQSSEALPAEVRRQRAGPRGSRLPGFTLSTWHG